MPSTHTRGTIAALALRKAMGLPLIEENLNPAETDEVTNRILIRIIKNSDPVAEHCATELRLNVACKLVDAVSPIKTIATGS